MLTVKVSCANETGLEQARLRHPYTVVEKLPASRKVVLKNSLLTTGSNALSDDSVLLLVPLYLKEGNGIYKASYRRA